MGPSIPSTEHHTTKPSPTLANVHTCIHIRLNPGMFMVACAKDLGRECKKAYLDFIMALHLLKAKAFTKVTVLGWGYPRVGHMILGMPTTALTATSVPLHANTNLPANACNAQLLRWATLLYSSHPDCSFCHSQQELSPWLFILSLTTGALILVVYSVTHNRSS